MNNFGINLLGCAQTVIGKQSYQLRKFSDRQKNENGFLVSSFEDPIEMSGSVQPVNAKAYKALGLNFKSAYIKIYDVNLIKNMSRNSNSDQVIYDGYLWEVAEDTNWFLSGSWSFVLLVRLGKSDL